MILEMELSDSEKEFIIKHKEYLKSHSRPMDIDRALTFPCEFVIIWEKRHDKLYFSAPCQITQCIGGINIGTNTTPKYTKCISSCPLCFHCGNLNKKRIYHNHAKTIQGKQVTLINGGYDEYGYNSATSIATEIEICLMKTVISSCLQEKNNEFVNQLVGKITKLKYFPFTSLKTIIDDITQQQLRLLEKERKKMDLLIDLINSYKIKNIKNEIIKDLETIPKGVPLEIIMKNIYTWYQRLDSGLDNCYLWDIVNIWKTSQKEFYKTVIKLGVPETHYRLYKKNNIEPVMKEFPVHNNHLHVKYQEVYKYYYGILGFKIILIKFLERKINNNTTKLVMNFISKRDILKSLNFI